MLFSHARTPLLVGAAMAGAVLVLADPPAATPVPGEPAALLQGETAQRIDDDFGPLAVEPSPADGCQDVIDAAGVTLTRPDAEVTDDDVLHLCTAVQGAAASSASCASRVYKVLADSTTCGRAYGAVASCAAPSTWVSPGWTRDLLTRATSACQMRLVSSLHQARVVDGALIRQVTRMAETETRAERQSRLWLALGSLARTARSGAHEAREAAADLDARIASRLHGASGYQRLYMLETAGNAACAGCVDDVRAALGADEPSVRRAAVAALRFRDDEAAVTSLCKALESEPNGLVREHAAWSLRWSTASEATRTECLDRAAREDLAENVRNAAMLSLFALADRVPAAAVALSALTGAGEPEEIAWFAASQADEAHPFDALGAFEGSALR